MHQRRFTPGVLIAVLATLACGPVRAQGEQPIRMVFPFAAGGSGDALARLLAERMRAGLNRTVIVENRAGGAGRIGIMAVKSAPADGSTLLFTAIAPMVINQHIYKALGYDPIADFAPVTQVGTFEFGLAVHASVPVKSVAELVAWAKANPARANYAIPSAGTLPHFVGAMFGRAAGLDLRPVAYKGAAPAIADLVAGQVPMSFLGTNDLVEMHRAGRIRVLATSGEQRSPFLPELPTLREAGYDLHATGWYGIFAPAKTPPDVVARLNAVIVGAVTAAENRERLLALGIAPTGTGAAAFAAIHKADSERWAAAVKASGFTPEQ